MADGGLTFTIDEQLAERLRSAARYAGAPDVETYVREKLDAAAHWDTAPADWDRLSQEAFEEYERTGVSYSIEEVFDEARRVIRERTSRGPLTERSRR